MEANDYYPFGQVMPSRTYALIGAKKTGFGFNGKEKDAEVGSDDYDFGARMYDARIGRWFSLDPLMAKFPYESPYVYVSDGPILYADNDGKSKYITFEMRSETGELLSSFTMMVDDKTLMSVPVKVQNSMDSHDDHWEYNWYDVNEVHTLVVKNGQPIQEKVDIKKGNFRIRTSIKSQSWANFWKENNPNEDAFSKGLSGIRWTTKEEGLNGQGNSYESGRSFVRSENIDMLLAAVQMAYTAAKVERLSLKTKTNWDVLKAHKDIFEFLGDNVDNIHTCVDEIKKFMNEKKDIKPPPIGSDSMKCTNCPTTNQKTISKKTGRDSDNKQHMLP